MSAATPTTIKPTNRSTTTFQAFTLIELLLILVVTAILFAAALPPLARAKDKAMQIHCIGHLKNVGLAHRIFATDHNDLFPWERSSAPATNQTNFPDLTGLSTDQQILRIYQSLANELSTPKILACPADTRRPADQWSKLTTNNVTYFIGLSARETLPQTFMAGDRNLTLNSNKLTGRVDLKNDASIAWDQSTHHFLGDITMGDGSVQQLTVPRLKEALANTGVETNSLLIP